MRIILLESGDGGATWTPIEQPLLGGGGGGATDLADLTDVGDATPTSGNVLVADGDSWESRALVEADISDLGTYATQTSLDNHLNDAADAHDASAISVADPFGLFATSNVEATLAEVQGNIPADTDDLTEGATNLYFTDARVAAAAGNNALLLSRGSTTVSGTTTPTSILSSTVNVDPPAAGDFFELNGYMNHSNTSGSNQTLALRVRLGSTTLQTITSAAIATGYLGAIQWRAFIRTTTAGGSGALVANLMWWRTGTFSTTVTETQEVVANVSPIDLSATLALDVQVTHSTNSGQSTTSYFTVGNYTKV